MSTNDHRRVGYMNVVLTVIAVCLGLLVVDRYTDGQAAHAQSVQPTPGQPGRSTGLISAADQRKMIIAEIKKLGVRLEGIEKTMKTGLTVKVSEMPEIKLPEQP